MADKEMDSWDEEEKKEPYRSHRWRAYMDLKRYREGYPDRRTDSTQQGEEISEMVNLEFYQNKKRYKPYGEFIEVILDQWKDNYVLLEQNHSYIQWLFPLREQGMNSKAKMLTETEIKKMKKDNEVMKRFRKAYKLMLGFYGIELVNEDTGEVERASNFVKRFENLDSHSHNNLRITRILKCLGELGFERYQAPLVRFFLKETLVENRLPSVKTSVLDYFMFTVKNKEQRRDLVHFAWENYEPKDTFIWGPIEQLKKYKNSKSLEPNKKSEDKKDRSNGNSKDTNSPKKPMDEEQGNNKPSVKHATMGEQDKPSDGEQEEGNETDREIDSSTQSRDGDDQEEGIHIQESEKSSGDGNAGRGAGDEDVKSLRTHGGENEGKPDESRSAICRNRGGEEPENDGKAESSGGSDVDNKTHLGKRIYSNERDGSPKSGSRSSEDLPFTLDQLCKIETDPKKLKRENNPGEGGGSVADGGLRESQINPVAFGSQDIANVEQDQLQDNDGRKCSTLDQTNGAPFQ